MSLTPQQLASSHDIWLPLSLRSPAKRAIVRRSRWDDALLHPERWSVIRHVNHPWGKDAHPLSPPRSALGQAVSSMRETLNLRQHRDGPDWIRRGWLEGMLLDLMSGEIRFVVCFMVPDPMVACLAGSARLRAIDGSSAPPQVPQRGHRESNMRPDKVATTVMPHDGLSMTQAIARRHYAVFSAAQLANYCWVDRDYGVAPVHNPTRER